MQIIFTDLDGTLLDPETYSCGAALPALQSAARLGAAVVFCTSKTRAEVEGLRRLLGNIHPFIVENGGAVYIPSGYFQPPAADGYEVLAFGDTRPVLLAALRGAAAESACDIRSFADMTAEEVAESCGLPPAQAALALEREYDEPFEILDPGRTGALLEAIEQCGKRWTRGNRFYHITGGNDKAGAVRALIERYRNAFPRVITVGLGDGLNDAGFLGVVDVPIIVRSRFAVTLKRAVPRGRVTEWPGPQGWSAAVLEVLASGATISGARAARSPLPGRRPGRGGLRSRRARLPSPWRP